MSVKSVAGCTTSLSGDSAAVTVVYPPTLTLGANPSVCQPLTAATISYSGATGGATIYGINWDSTTLGAGFSNISGATLSGSTISLPVPTGATGSFGGNITISNGYCTSTTYGFTLQVRSHPSAAITDVPTICSGYSANITFSGTPDAYVAYQIDGGSITSSLLTSGTFVLTTGALTGTHTIALLDAHNDVCSVTIDSTITITATPLVWVGGASGSETDWNTAVNWSCGFVPGATDNVTIPAGTLYAPVIATAANGTTNDLTVAAGASVKINSIGVLNIKGNLTNNGTIMGDGTASINGASAQTIAGTGSINNLDLNNNGGATIATGASATVTGTFSVTSGDFATNDSLILYSDSTGTARIASLPATGSSISGNVTVLQYIFGGRRAYRFWAHPFSDYISLNQLENYIDVTGPGGSANGFTTTGSNAPSAYRYNPLVGNSGNPSDPGWRPFTSAYGTIDSNRLHQYQGIRLFFRGKKGQGLGYGPYTDISPVTVGMFGHVNQGNQTVTLSKGSGANQDYNMVGNPYASPVDIGTVIYNAAVAGRIAGVAFYVWNPYLGAAGQFQAIPYGSSMAAPYYLQANNSFQVRAAHNGDTLNFTEGNKSPGVSATLLRTTGSDLNLVVYDENYHPWDVLSINFDENATSNEDNRYDALKPTGADFNFYSISTDGQKLAIDARPFATGNVIPLGVSSSFALNLILKATSVPAGKKLYLHDKLLGKYMQLTEGAEYPWTVTTDVKTQGDNRFEITTATDGVSKEATELFSVTLTPNPTADEVVISLAGTTANEAAIHIYDVTGRQIYENKNAPLGGGKTTVRLTNYPAGVYIVEITSGPNVKTLKLVKE